MVKIDRTQALTDPISQTPTINPAYFAASDPATRPIPVTERTSFYRDRIIPENELYHTGSLGLGHTTSVDDFYHSNLGQLNPSFSATQQIQAPIVADQNTFMNQEAARIDSTKNVERNY